MAFTGLAVTAGNFSNQKGFATKDILFGATENTGSNLLLVSQDGLLDLNGSNYLVKGHAKKSKSRGKSQDKGKKPEKKSSKSKGRKKSTGGGKKKNPKK